MSAQVYTSPTSLAWLAKGRCPECGGKASEHTGWGRAGCSLTDNGVAARIDEFQRAAASGERSGDA